MTLSFKKKKKNRCYHSMTCRADKKKDISLTPLSLSLSLFLLQIGDMGLGVEIQQSNFMEVNAGEEEDVVDIW